MAYWSPQALPKLRSSEGRYDQIHYPTGYTKSGVRSSASGAYGFLDTTWQTYAAKAGVDTNQYPRAYMAPPSVQDQVAAITPTSNWTCSGCNTTATQLASDPANVTATPVSASGGFVSTDDPAWGGGPTGTRADDTAGDYGGGGAVNPNQFTDPSIPPLEPDPNNPQAPYPWTGQPQSQGGGLGAILTWGWDKLLRLALIVLGVLLVIVAAWAMVEGEFSPQGMVSKLGKKALS